MTLLNSDHVLKAHKKKSINENHSIYLPLINISKTQTFDFTIISTFVFHFNFLLYYIYHTIYKHIKKIY